MVDINLVRENKEAFKKAIEEKKISLDLDHLLRLDEKRRELLTQTDKVRRQRNEAAKNRDIESGKKIKEELDKLEEDLKVVEKDFESLIIKVPTIPAADVPKGEGEDDNVEIYKWGEIPQFSFDPKDHIEIGKILDILDLERGAKVGGYKGYYLKNEGVMLVMGIMVFALQKLIKAGYTPMIPPTLVKEFALFGSGYFKSNEYNPDTDEIYQVNSMDEDKKFLVGTAEPSLLAYYSGEILEEDQLPMKLCGYSQCYRREIGSYGKETRGIYRVHEFMKVEQVVITKANVEEAERIQQEMVALSKSMHEELGLPYRQLQICTGDLSAGKYKQFDIEAWLPGMNKYGETGSASNFLDWQSRRLKVQYKTKDGEKKYVYMLNNTALPTPRILIAILENYQQADGLVKVPQALVPLVGFSEIKPKK